MRRYLLSCCIATLLATPAVGEPWARGYVFTNYEPAWYFGGGVNFHKEKFISPGSDCPKGSYPDLNYDKILLTPWRNAKVVYAINHPHSANPDSRLWLQNYALTYRGFRDDIDVYLNPFAAPDPGMQEVTGKIAEGFDLDSNAKTGGFSSPSGQRGVDNALYRAWGCLSLFRASPYHAAMSVRANDKMVEGLYTIVIRISGNKDPMNDDDATVEIGYSPDKMVKTASGEGIVSDYSFRIAQDKEYSKFKAVIKNGVMESGPVDELHMPRIAWFPNQYGDADLHNGRIRLEMDPDGGVSGLVGGYRDWRELFSEDNFTQNGSTAEYRDHQDSIAMYYALKRNADGMPDPKTGRNMGISTAYRFLAKPAFVVTAPIRQASRVASSPSIEKQIESYDALHATFLKALDTLRIQPIPSAAYDEGGISHFKTLSNGKRVLKDDEALSVPPAPEDMVEPPSTSKKDAKQVRNMSSVLLTAIR